MQDMTSAQLADCLRRLGDAERALSDIRSVISTLASNGNGGGNRASDGEPRKLEAFPMERGISGGTAKTTGSGKESRRGQEVQDAQVAATPHLGVAPHRGTMSEEEEERAEVFAGVLAMPEDAAAIGDEGAEEEVQERLHAMQEYETVHLSVEQKVKKRGIHASVVQKYLRTERAEQEACTSLLQAIGLVVLFATSSILHWNLEPLHANLTAIASDVTENANFAFGGTMPFENGKMGHKSFWDVNRINDFWSWLDVGVVPLFWPEGWDLSETRSNTIAKCISPHQALLDNGWNASFLTDVSQQSEYTGQCPEGLDQPQGPTDFYGSPAPPTYLYYHTILGGMELSQERAWQIECGDKEANEQFGGVCTRDRGFSLKPELHSALEHEDDHINQPGGKTEYLLSNVPRREILKKLRRMESESWFDPWTMRIQMLYTTFNPHLNAFTATYIVLLLNRSGHFHKVIQPITVWLDQYHWWSSYVVDSLFMLLIIKLFLEESFELTSYVRQLGLHRGIRKYVNILNFVDWINVLYALAITVYWFFYLGKLEELKDFIRTADPTMPGSWPEPERLAFYKTTEEAVYMTISIMVMCAVYPFLCVLRFFHTISAQPRLAMVTQTLWVAGTDILHFGLVFFCVFFVYVFSGMMIFGQDNPEYSNIYRAATATFQVLLGEYDWRDLYEFGALQAAPWFWTFHIFVNLIMLNMLLAIIMDVYSGVKSQIGANAPTLWRQMWDTVTRWRDVRAGRKISLSHILHVLDPTDLDEEDNDASSDPRLKPHSFCTLVEGLSPEQAFEVLCAAAEMEKVATKAQIMDDSDISLAIKVVDMRLKDIWERIIYKRTDGPKRPSAKPSTKSLASAGGGGGGGSGGGHSQADRNMSTLPPLSTNATI